MSADLGTMGCRLPGCRGPRSGVCINNLPFDECPDVLPVEESGQLPGSNGASPDEAYVVSLPGGRSLDTAACDALLRQRGGTVVGLVASPDVGKTTLIATVYELLHRHRMARFGFAGSETLQGYEQRCYLARLASKASKADTHRTPVGSGLSFTHLRVACPEGLRDIVFSDRSGEHFEAALSRPSEVDGFVELRRADAVVLLADLTQLVSHTHVTTSGLRRLFMALDRSGMLDGRKVLLVGTKADLVGTTGGSRKGERELATIGDELDRRASGRFAVGRHIVACRARSGTTGFGEGVEALFAALMTPEPIRQSAPDVSWPDEPTELDKLVLTYRSARW